MDIFTDDDKKIYESKKLKLSRDTFRFELNNCVNLNGDVRFSFITRKKVCY